MVRFRIRTNWTNSVSQTHEFALEDLADAATRDRLKWAFADPERLRPGETRQSLTERAAAAFAAVAQALQERGHEPQVVAHFVNRLVFCMFADDVGHSRAPPRERAQRLGSAPHVPSPLQRGGPVQRSLRYRRASSLCCASGCSWSAAKRYQRAASRRSRRTPRPRSYIQPRCA